ncbi:MAG: SgcJ/EcaC family oxidoreductase [Alphaproteobacteria bacterium]|nr:MAG: SgcJ/EcaC family oxidoreductase [Alphaproteobacteria bacterium]
MIARVAAIVFMTFAAAACAPDEAARRNADIAALQAIGKTWEEAYRAGDVETLRGLYTKDAVVMPRHRAALVGIDAILEFFAHAAAAYDTAVIDVTDETQVMGDVAIMIGRFWLDGTPKGDAPPFKDAGRYLIVLKRTAGDGWKIYRDIDQRTPDADPANPPSPL